MTAVWTRVGSFLRCDGCGVTATCPGLPPWWQRDEYPGGPHHWCPECALVYGIDVGDQAACHAAWEALTEDDGDGAA